MRAIIIGLLVIAATLGTAPIRAADALLLEAADASEAGAVPFDGSVEWSIVRNDEGLLTLRAKAFVPARDLAVAIDFHANVDDSLPAEELFELNFTVPNDFPGKSISGLPGILYKDEELVQGTPIVGASARVVGNQFLFVTPRDGTHPSAPLTRAQWIDLAIIYEGGKRAILTLALDDAAHKGFGKISR